MMKPVKAFLYQDHKAHITVHMAAMHDPKIQALLQGNPMAQSLQQAMMAHVNEHLGFEYRKQIEQQLGMTLPPQKDESGEDINMPPEVEARLAPMLAQAAQQLLETNAQEAAQQQAQQQAQDPIVQMQMQELQIKAQAQKAKEAKDQADIALKQQQIQVEKDRIAMQAKVDSAKAVMQSQNQKEDSNKKIMVDALKQLSAQNSKEQMQKRQLYVQGLQAAHQAAEGDKNRDHQEKLQSQKPKKGE
jgi:hypothetical protein